MRRRAMSHNPNRMPRTLREAHKAQVSLLLKVYLHTELTLYLCGFRWQRVVQQPSLRGLEGNIDADQADCWKSIKSDLVKSLG